MTIALTIYVNPKISSGALDSVLKLRPRRVVFNPGAENGGTGSPVVDGRY